MQSTVTVMGVGVAEVMRRRPGSLRVISLTTVVAVPDGDRLEADAGNRAATGTGLILDTAAQAQTVANEPQPSSDADERNDHEAIRARTSRLLAQLC